MSNYKRFEDLEIWKEGMEICKEIYLLLKDCKDYGLKDQMQRASVSIPSNIAEGCERNSPKEKQHFMYIAKSSCGALRTQLHLAIFLKYIDSEKGNLLIQRVAKLSIMIFNYIQYLNTKSHV
jgi:four helix bundle protein